MTRTSRILRTTASAAAVTTALTLAACSSSGGSGGSGGPSSGSSGGRTFLVGTVQPLSGAYAGAGTDIVNALQAQAKIINARGGILGRTVKVISVDSASTEQKSISATQKLIQTQHLDMFEPDVIYGQSDLPFATDLLSVSLCAAPDCGDGKKYPMEFTLNPSAANQVPPVLAYARQQRQTKVGIITTNDAQGASFTSTVKAGAARFGLTVTRTTTFDPAAADVTSQLQTLRASGARFVAAWAAVTTVDTVMKGMQSLGWTAPVVGTPTVFTSDVTSGVPASVQSQLKCLCYAVGTRTGDTVDPTVAPLVSGIGSAPIASMQVAGLAADTLTLAKYGYTKAGTLDAKKAAAAIGSIGSDANYPAGEFYAFNKVNPSFSETDHSPAGDKLSGGFYAVASVSKVVSGTYVGTLFTY
jgi:branched-chain amino acid transport system substrate-binding protein